MEIIPAIDIRGGRCVRLEQGDYERETVFDDDPVAVAEALAGGRARGDCTSWTSTARGTADRGTRKPFGRYWQRRRCPCRSAAAFAISQ